eukprot:jgi/Picsp_1/56/NSC_00056-R1_---NA---
MSECNGVEEDVVTVGDGTEFHLDVRGEMGGLRSQPKVTREFETAYKVKARVIEALITSYKSINKDCITTAWKVSGKTVIEEFYKGTFQNNAQRWRGYNQAWEEQFIPIPGRKKKQQQSAEEDVDMEEGETTEFSGEISEYGSKDCPDEEEEEEYSDEDVDLVEGLNELALNEEMDQTGP